MVFCWFIVVAEDFRLLDVDPDHHNYPTCENGTVGACVCEGGIAGVDRPCNCSDENLSCNYGNTFLCTYKGLECSSQAEMTVCLSKEQAGAEICVDAEDIQSKTSTGGKVRLTLNRVGPGAAFMYQCYDVYCSKPKPRTYKQSSRKVAVDFCGILSLATYM